MEKEQNFSGEQQEKKYEKPYGLDTQVRSFYFRHAEKASGDVGAVGQISNSLISDKGSKESVFLGEQLGEPSPDGFKIDWSKQPRTLETGEKMTEGYLKNLQKDGLVKKFNSRSKIELSDKHYTKEFTDRYIADWEDNKKRLLNEKGLNVEDFKNLSTEDQALIAEEAEEPVISKWLNDEDSELAKLMSVKDAAANLAWRLKRDIRMPEKLKSGSRVDLFKMTHKTITEPLLMKILVLPNGEKPNKLEDIGGSLSLNEGWEVDSSIDENGEENIKFYLYRVDRSEKEPKYIKQEYNVDLGELDRLAELGMKDKKYNLEEE